MHPQLLDKGYVFDAHEEYLQNDVCRLTRLQLIVGEQLLMCLVFSQKKCDEIVVELEILDPVFNVQLNVLIHLGTRDHILNYVMPVREDPLSCQRVKVFL